MMTRPAIGQEFKSQLKELESEDMIRKQKDELKSQALIRKIQQQDKLKTDQSDSQTEEITTQVRKGTFRNYVCTKGGGGSIRGNIVQTI